MVENSVIQSSDVTTEEEQLETMDGYVEVSVVNDGMEAKMRVVSPKGSGKEPVYEDALEEIKKQKIVFGVDEKEIRGIFTNGLFNKEITIARGMAPIEGKNGTLKYHKSSMKEIKPQEDEKGNVDFKNVSTIQSVRKGETLAEVTPPTDGEDGKDVYGNVKLAKRGKEYFLPRGRNTTAHPENPNLLIASIDGCIIFKGNEIDVSPVMIVKEHVDFSTGNIDYNGILIIKGDIKSGFTVKVDGNLEIGGVVEDAHIECTGKVIMKKGFLGSGKGILKAQGDVILKYCENQTIQSEGMITAEALLHSQVEATKKVIVKGSKGLIVGGSTMALEGIEAKNVGNIHYSKTELTVGVKTETRKRLEEIEDNLQKNEENLKNLKNAIVTIVKSDKTKGGISPEKKKLMKKMQDIINSIQVVQENYNREKAKIEQELEEFSQVKIIVKDKVYPGVKIYIQNKKTSIKKELPGTIFGVENNELVSYDYSRGKADEI